MSPELLAAWVDGEVTPSQAAAVEQALSQSPDLRRRSEELRRITAGLSAPVPELDALDLTSSIRAAARAEERRRRLPPPRRAAGWRWPALVGFAGACVAAVALLVVRPASRSPDDADFRAKSATAKAAGAPELWAGVMAYRVAGKGAPARLGEHLSRGDGLMFSYTNLGPRPFTHVMVFAVDAEGEVRWFYPAYETVGTNPSSIPIQADANVPLAEVIRHPFAAGPLTLQALFSRQPLRVADVEAWLATRPTREAAPPWADVYRQIVVSSVEP